MTVNKEDVQVVENVVPLDVAEAPADSVKTKSRAKPKAPEAASKARPLGKLIRPPKRKVQ